MKRKITSFVLLLAMLVSIVAVLPIASAAANTTLAGTNVTLTDGVLLNFYIEADEAVGVTNAQLVDGQYIITEELAAKKMGDDVTVQLKNGATPVGEAYTSSVKAYAEGVLASDDYDALTKALVTAMLNYGAAAQKYFKYKTDALVGTPVTDTTALKAATVAPVAVEGDGFIGASLILEGTMTLRFYFAGTVDSATVDGEAADVNADAAEYCYVDVKVTPDNIDKAYTVVAGDTTVTYSVLNYLKRNADNADLAEIVASIYAYGVAADAYVNSRKTPLENLQDETLSEYVYPVNTVSAAEGTIAYGQSKPKNHLYQVYNENKVSFIEITGCTFDKVTFEVDPAKAWVGWAFLTKLPKLGDLVSYATGYTTFKTATETVTTDIPSDAKYLSVYYQDAPDDVYFPESITFKKSAEKTPLDNLQDEDLAEYSYPISAILPSQGTIRSSDNKYVPDNEWIAAFVDITNSSFDKVTIGANPDTGFFGYGFLTRRPDMYDSVSYATGYSNMIYVEDGSVDRVTVDIPDDATCLVIYYQNQGPVYFIPEYVIFSRAGSANPQIPKTPLENLRDETLSEYVYPFDQIVPVDHVISYVGNYPEKQKYTTYEPEKLALIDITDTVFDTVTLKKRSTASKTIFTFLNQAPVVDKAPSYAIGYNTFIESTDDTTTVAIPADAKYLVVLYSVEYTEILCPETITFSKDPSNPDNCLKDTSLQTYNYPIDNIKPSMGSIASSDHRYRPGKNDWITSFLYLGEDCAFDTVTLTVNATTGNLGYSFLTKCLEKNEYASDYYATGYDKVIYLTDQPIGTTVELEIPDDAVCMVIYYQDWDDSNSRPIYFIPDAITFKK